MINGAGGGAGSFAIQLAKYFGAEVTAVDKESKFELMNTLGADSLIDYNKENFTRSNTKYDLILDFVGSNSMFKIRNSLSAEGRYVMVGGSVPHLLQILIFGSLISMRETRKRK